jgi:tetratricopeptide (TPR) repeat protein
MKRTLGIWLLAGGVIVLFTGCATTQPPQDATAYYDRGVDYYRKGQYDKAISDFNRALEINPRYAEAYINRGITYRSQRPV